LASSVSASEVAAQQYVAALDTARLLDHSSSIAITAWAAVDAWAKTGALFKDRYAVESGLAVDAVFRVADECRDSIPGREDWVLASCEKEFNPDGPGRRYAWHMHQHPALKSDPANSGHSLHRLRQRSFAGRTESVKSARAFIDEDYAFSRLEILKEKGRGEAWLMHCLVEAPMADIQMALDAGLDLKGASQDATQAFFFAMMRRVGDYERLIDAAGSVSAASKTKAQKERLAAARETGFIERWERWEIAVKAGLPLVAFTPEQEEQRAQWAAQGESAHVDNNALALAILAQETLRDGKTEGIKRREWLRAAGRGPWTASIAQKLGAPEGQSAIGWAVSQGAFKDSVSHEELLLALWQDDKKNRAEVLIELAKAGVRMSDSVDAHPRGLVASMMENGAGFEAARALSKMGADFFWEKDVSQGGKPWKQGLLNALIAVGGANGAIYARHAVDAMEEASPGSSKKLFEARDEHGAGALHWSANMLTTEGLQLCFDHGMDVNGKDDKGQTALHWAAKKYGKNSQDKFVPIVKWLAEHGFDWAATNDKGETALAALAKKGSIDALAEIMDKAKMDDLAGLAEAVEKKDAKGRSAFDHLSGRADAGKALAHAEGVVMSSEIKKLSMANRKKAAAAAESAAPPGAKETTGPEGVGASDAVNETTKAKPRRM